MAKTVEEIQTRLRDLGYYKGEVDGLAGKITSEAVVAFQAAKGLVQNGKVDPQTLAALFPSVVQAGPTTIKAKLMDYVLNLVKSKSAWAAAALVAFLTGWVQTKFGFEVDEATKDSITVLVTTGFGGLIWLLQAAFNSPHMTTKQPAVVKQPAEHD
jgi:peptidoglycan hydrolase-like protein with peptidoglycan-binding domain